MTDIAKLMKQAQEMQKNIEAAQQELIAMTVEGVALAGKVKVALNGRYNVLRVELSDDLLNEDKNIIQSAIAGAFNDAARKIEEYSKEKMGALMANTDMPTDMGELG